MDAINLAENKKENKPNNLISKTLISENLKVKCKEIYGLVVKNTLNQESKDKFKELSHYIFKELYFLLSLKEDFVIIDKQIYSNAIGDIIFKTKGLYIGFEICGWWTKNYEFKYKYIPDIKMKNESSGGIMNYMSWKNINNLPYLIEKFKKVMKDKR